MEYVLRYRQPYHKMRPENTHDSLLQWNVSEREIEADSHEQALEKAKAFLAEHQTSGESSLPNRQPISLISIVKVWDRHTNLRLHK